MAYWLMKSEPDAYGWDDLVRDGEGYWDGVRNPTAALHMRTMKQGDQVLFYHSNTGLEAVGIMEVSGEAEPDRTDATGRWVAVRVKPVKPLPKPVSLKAIKAEPRLADLPMIRQSRLSVVPVSPAEWKVIMEMAGA
ncbi:EVE domain-containing protein [Sphingomonas cavernae]|uniref:EVE domain-containing protein n=1 Tax=Sphingomonas cavernae TaxID=2320861 RepID=A0A418WKC6_9SPHN|nr:EVE domain-containing protein [Sphingomonas cavernae]RJF90486.1 EVE domain-containing protein [Sphingomonas cavernae]